ncbi:Chromate transport protein [Eubacteriaceae bacterium CHKCI005]|nr:Chromate transport protein [Eubacteriaceae bacterium CHKCI005]
MTYLLLFYEFFKTGLFAIGGGLATLPFLYEMADQYPQWFDQSMLADMIAISESTPGPIGVNMATYAGYHAGGVLGSIVATAALVLPSVIIILLIAKFLSKFSENKLVQSAFYGLRPTVTALIAAAGFEVVKVSILTLDQFTASWNVVDLFDVKALILFAVLMTVSLLLKGKGHPVLYIAAAAVIGVIFKF